MYLVERIIGVAVYVLLLGAVCLFISRARGVGDRRRAVVLYAIVLCVMALRADEDVPCRSAVRLCYRTFRGRRTTSCNHFGYFVLLYFQNLHRLVRTVFADGT